MKRNILMLILCIMLLYTGRVHAEEFVDGGGPLTNSDINTLAKLNTQVADATLLDDGAIADSTAIGLNTGATHATFGVAGDDSLNEMFTAIDTGIGLKLTTSGAAAAIHMDDILTTIGVAEEATHMGTFTGTTISDSVTAKAALQALETSLELKLTASAIGTDYDTEAELIAKTPAAVQTVSVATTASLTPTAAYRHVDIQLTGTGADPAVIVMAKAGAINGATITVTNVAAPVCTFAYNTGVLEHNGGSGNSISLSQWQSFTAHYAIDRWVVTSNEGSIQWFSSVASMTPVSDDADDFDNAGIFGLTTNMYGGTFIANGTGIINLPSVVAGMNFTVITLGAIAVTINPDDANQILADGVLLDNGDALLNTSTAGDIAVCQYLVADDWVCTTNSWTDAS